MKIIFMGTADFALPALDLLIKSDKHQVSAVFTSPPKPQGRGLLEQKSPIHELAISHNIQVFTPSSLRNQEIRGQIADIEADIIVVAAYGFIIPKDILELKKYGSINIHPSKLPRYRGAAPLQRVIINRDLESAVCIIQMDEGLDTGDILLQEDINLSGNETLKEYHDFCANKGAELAVKVLDNIDIIKPIKQLSEGASYAKKLTKDEGRLNWNESAEKNDAKVRGMIIWPKAYFYINEKMVQVLESKPIKLDHNKALGTLLDNTGLVACKEGALQLVTVKPEGKKAMNMKDFINGLSSSSNKREIIFN